MGRCRKSISSVEEYIMDIHTLQCFLTLARNLNFTKTAEKEHLTQSSLSRKITCMEDELGIRLFYRDSHQVSLTEAGREFYFDTLKYMESYYAAVINAQNIHNGFQRSIKIGLGLYEHDLLSPFLPDFVRKHPEIEVGCYQYSYLELMKRFEQNLVDVIFTSDKYFSEFDLQDTEIHLIHCAPWVLAVSVNNPLASMSVITRKALEGKTMISMSEGSVTRLLNHYQKLGIFENVVYANTFQTKMLMIDSGLGVGVIPEFVNIGAYANIRKKETETIFCPRSFYLIYRKKTENQQVHIFIESYLKQCGIKKQEDQIKGAGDDMRNQRNAE